MTTTRKAATRETPDFRPFLSFNHSELPGKMEEFRKIMSESATAIWAKEIELAKLEVEQATRMLLPPRRDGDGRHAAAEYRNQLREGSEKIVGEMRNLSDMMRRCGWQLFDLYTRNDKTAD
jgi:hypothetical protein